MQAKYLVLFIALFYLVKSSDTRNWQQIKVYLGEVIPDYVFLENNSTITLYCGCNTSLVYWTFRRSTVPLDSSGHPVSNRHVKNSKQLTLINLTTEDAGLYSCSWTSGDRDFESLASVVRISRHYDDVFSLGMIAPSWLEVSQNSTVILNCHSVMPTEWFSVYFQHNCKIIKQVNSLTLLNLQGEHSGEYICRGSFYNREHHHVIFHAISRIIVDSTLIRIHHVRPPNLQTRESITSYAPLLP